MRLSAALGAVSCESQVCPTSPAGSHEQQGSGLNGYCWRSSPAAVASPGICMGFRVNMRLFPAKRIAYRLRCRPSRGGVDRNAELLIEEALLNLSPLSRGRRLKLSQIMQLINILGSRAPAHSSTRTAGSNPTEGESTVANRYGRAGLLSH